MIYDLTTDTGFTDFQFWWYALTFSAPPVVTTPRLETEEKLRRRLVRLSVARADGGRVLRKECSVNLSLQERIALVERIQATTWTKKAAPVAKRVARRLSV